LGAHLLTLAWIGLQLAGYFLFGRHRAWARRESGIGAYHAGSILLLTLALAGAQGLGWLTFSVIDFLGAIAIHAVYSLSLVELWLLVDGSYSLRILSPIARIGHCDTRTIHDRLAKLGAEKQQARTHFLVARGLVCQRGDLFELSTAGKLVARALAVLAWVPNYRSRG